MNKRTCPLKHNCERAHFAWRNQNGKDSPSYMPRYEVYHDHTHDPEWDDPSNTMEWVFASDDKSECEKWLKLQYELVENGVCLVCNMYDKRKVDLAEGRVQPFYIVAYGISRYCYSPAEGGCWADWTDVHEVRRAFTVQEGVRQLRALKEKYPQPRFDRFSCANRGEDDEYFVLCYGENDPRWPVQSTQRATYS